MGKYSTNPNSVKRNRDKRAASTNPDQLTTNLEHRQHRRALREERRRLHGYAQSGDHYGQEDDTPTT